MVCDDVLRLKYEKQLIIHNHRRQPTGDSHRLSLPSFGEKACGLAPMVCDDDYIMCRTSFNFMLSISAGGTGHEGSSQEPEDRRSAWYVIRI